MGSANLDENLINLYTDPDQFVADPVNRNADVVNLVPGPDQFVEYPVNLVRIQSFSIGI